MSYRKRYWIDSAGRWRDRRNSNRLSDGPSRKVDRRRYRVKTPPAWQTPKRRKPKPKERPAPQPTDVLPHNSPPEFVSPFAKFLESVDIGHPNVIVSTYLILKRTSTSYISSNNPNGVRVFAVQFGDMTRAEARRQTLADVNTSFYKFDPDWIPHLRALRGKNLSRTPASGDKTRSRIWKNIQKASVKAKEEKPKKGKKTKRRHK